MDVDIFIRLMTAWIEEADDYVATKILVLVSVDPMRLMQSWTNADIVGVRLGGYRSRIKEITIGERHWIWRLAKIIWTLFMSFWKLGPIRMLKIGGTSPLDEAGHAKTDSDAIMKLLVKHGTGSTNILSVIKKAFLAIAGSK